MSVDCTSIHSQDPAGLASSSFTELPGANKESMKPWDSFEAPSGAGFASAIIPILSGSVKRTLILAEATLSRSSLKRKTDTSAVSKRRKIAVSSSSLCAIDHRVPGLAGSSAIWTPYQRCLEVSDFQNNSRNVRRRMKYFNV